MRITTLLCGFSSGYAYVHWQHGEFVPAAVGIAYALICFVASYMAEEAENEKNSESRR